MVDFRAETKTAALMDCSIINKMGMSRTFCMLMALFAFVGKVQAQISNPPPTTAFSLIKVGDAFLPATAKGKVTHIRSEKSTDGLLPKIWWIDYFDPTATFRCAEIKFVDGKETELTHPSRVFDTFTGSQRMEGRKLKIDSDRALTLALAAPPLSKWSVQATQFWLDRQATAPVWRIRFWGSPTNATSRATTLGDVEISARTGEILSNKIKPPPSR